MPSVTIDLPSELLEEVSRLAQALNVPRADVYRHAVAAYARSLLLERELAEARDGRDTAVRERLVAVRAHAAGRSQVAGLAGLLEEARRERDLAVRQSHGSALAVRRLTADLAVARTTAASAEQRREDAERRALDLEERDRQKVLAVLRDQEVATLRRRHQELAVVVQKLEQDLVYQRMDAGLKDRKITGLERQVDTLAKQKREFEAGFKREQKETFKSERQIGRLMQERARLRDELKRLAGLINRAPGAAAPPRLGAGPKKVQSKP